ncbi:hypothetical protein V5O48_010191 [Marasmius crinis-equi]|uniref:F-box domain-containing protein n=1 Tax=Marasmius crinis-equi TaxID=585013 RepID=A0ABR3F914_9AGAR
MDADDVAFSSLPLPLAKQMNQMLIGDTVSPRDKHAFLWYTEKELREVRVEIDKEATDTFVLADQHSSLRPLPTHQLPPENLTKILAMACVGVRITPRDIPDVLSISQVCCRWRETILSTPFSSSDFGVFGYDPEGDEEDHAVLARTVRLLPERS